MNVACYVTAVAWNRQPFLTRADVATIILEQVTFYRKKHHFYHCGYVIMPDHWHFVMIVDEKKISAVLRDMKSMIARKVIDLWKQSSESQQLLKRIRLPETGKRNHLYSLWQAGNWKVLIEDEFNIEKRINYIHANPLRAGLVKRPEEWPWSSYRWYEFREPVGVEIDMDWLL